MSTTKPRTRRRCLICIVSGLLTAAAAFVAVTSRRGPVAGMMPEVLIRASEQATLPEVLVEARRPEGLVPEVLVRAASPDAAVSTLPVGREWN